jgi:hypothetical protein
MSGEQEWNVDRVLLHIAWLDSVGASWHLAAGEPYAARLLLARAAFSLRTRRSLVMRSWYVRGGNWS